MYEPTAEIASLTAELETLSQERESLRAKMRAVKSKLNLALLHEQCDRWGLTPREYGEAKAKAKLKGVPAHVTLNAARAAANRERREAQTAAVESSSVGIHAKSV